MATRSSTATTDCPVGRQVDGRIDGARTAAVPARRRSGRAVRDDLAHPLPRHRPRASGHAQPPDSDRNPARAIWLRRRHLYRRDGHAGHFEPLRARRGGADGSGRWSRPGHGDRARKRRRPRRNAANRRRSSGIGPHRQARRPSQGRPSHRPSRSLPRPHGSLHQHATPDRPVAHGARLGRRTHDCRRRSAHGCRSAVHPRRRARRPRRRRFGRRTDRLAARRQTESKRSTSASPCSTQAIRWARSARWSASTAPALRSSSRRRSADAWASR